MIRTDFNTYAKKHFGVTDTQFRDWEVLQTQIYNNVMVTGSLTPYVLEERELRVTQIDIFSRMMLDRILWLAGPVNDRMSTVVQAQLMFLDNQESKDITMYVDTPGGSVKSGLSIVDTMEYVSSDIITINTGMAASMGSILLGAGTKGKRYSLPSSRVMLHQVSAGTEGNIQDMRVSMVESEKYNDHLFKMLASYTGKTAEEVMKDAERDFWLTADEALAYGIIDGIVKNKPKGKK